MKQEFIEYQSELINRLWKQILFYLFLEGILKLEAMGKKKNCEIIGDWSRSISNRTYWCAMSSEGDEELVSKKWCSILNHVCNVHEGHGNKLPRCEHGDLDDRLWIKKGTSS